jgi:hypothetical protein
MDRTRKRPVSVRLEGGKVLFECAVAAGPVGVFDEVRHREASECLAVT